MSSNCVHVCIMSFHMCSYLWHEFKNVFPFLTWVQNMFPFLIWVQIVFTFLTWVSKCVPIFNMSFVFTFLPWVSNCVLISSCEKTIYLQPGTTGATHPPRHMMTFGSPPSPPPTPSPRPQCQDEVLRMYLMLQGRKEEENLAIFSAVHSIIVVWNCLL